MIFSKPDHKTADSIKMEIAETYYKGNFRRSVFSYLVVYDLFANMAYLFCIILNVSMLKIIAFGGLENTNKEITVSERALSCQG